MYVGAITDAIPIAAPPIARNNDKKSSESANPEPTALITNMIAAMRIGTSRPRPSAMRPAASAPAAAPSNADATVSPSAADPAWKRAAIAPTAPLMTALS